MEIGWHIVGMKKMQIFHSVFVLQLFLNPIRLTIKDFFTTVNIEIHIAFCFSSNHLPWYEFSKLLMKINEDTGKPFIKMFISVHLVNFKSSSISIALVFLIVYLWQIGAKFVGQIITALRNRNKRYISAHFFLPLP